MATSHRTNQNRRLSWRRNVMTTDVIETGLERTERRENGADELSGDRWRQSRPMNSAWTSHGETPPPDQQSSHPTPASVSPSARSVNTRCTDKTKHHQRFIC